MKLAGLTVGILIICCSVSTGASPYPVKSDFNLQDMEQLIVSTEDVKSSEALDRLHSSLTYLHKKKQQYNNQENFAEYLYFYVHKKYLKKYKKYTSFAETVDNGTYDCLTGTALYSLFLSELDIGHSIVETNYHIYILINPGSGKEILLESTDPHYGFVTDQKKIARLKKEYVAENDQKREVLVQFNIDINHRLKDKEIIGLLFYNQSIRNINLGLYDRARDCASQAIKYYSGERVTNLITWLNLNYRPITI
jgi:hypothetical protein